MTNDKESNIAVQGPNGSWCVSEWQGVVADTAEVLCAINVNAGTVVISQLDNGPAFIAIDQALELLEAVHVPLPQFFTDEQVNSIGDLVGAEWLLETSVGERVARQCDHVQIAGNDVFKRARIRRSGAIKPHDGTGLITFTSGSTGNPKGVCLSRAHMRSVSDGIREVLQRLDIKRHLSALPYGVLLEHVAGINTAFSQGTTIVSLPLASVGLKGSSSFDPCIFDHCLRAYKIESVILLPQMLKAWVHYLEKNSLVASVSLKFVAAGGAPVGKALIQRSTELQIPVHEGYGLSEGGSVQTLNLAPDQCTGGVGKSLPHSKLTLGDDGEIWLHKPVMLGYLGHPPQGEQPFPTGDLGVQSADGTWQIVGRKKNVIVTSFGRNVSPEWLETLLCEQPIIAHAVVIGDSMPRLAAVIWPVDANVTRLQIAEAIKTINSGLPDYAQVASWCFGSVDSDSRQLEFTPNGRPKRLTIAEKYRSHLQI